MKRLILLIVLASCTAQAQFCALASGQMGKRKGDTHFTITFLSGELPESITLGADYSGAASIEEQAQYDAGDGVWVDYSSKTIPVKGGYIKLRGDWRNSGGAYRSLFNGSFTSDAYTIKFTGQLDYAATAGWAYAIVFANNTTEMVLAEKPFQPIAGAPATYMFNGTFYNSSFTGALPTGTLDTSGLAGAPAMRMFNATFYNSSFTGALPTGTLDTSGLVGAPAAAMFSSTFRGSSFTGGDIRLGSGIIFTADNVTILPYAFSMSNWTGQVYWGTQLLTDAIPAPAVRNYAFMGATKMPGYADLHANWK